MTLTDPQKRCSCGAGCATFGACLRSKGLGFNGVFTTRSKGFGHGDATKQKRWDKELDLYRGAVAQGIEPAGTTTSKVMDAIQKSDAAGAAYDASTGGFK